MSRRCGASASWPGEGSVGLGPGGLCGCPSFAANPRCVLWQPADSFCPCHHPIGPPGHLSPLRVRVHTAVIPGSGAPTRCVSPLYMCQGWCLLRWNPGTNSEKYSKYKATDKPGTSYQSSEICAAFPKQIRTPVSRKTPKSTYQLSSMWFVGKDVSRP